MIHTRESFSTGLKEIHELYQCRIAATLAEFVHIDLTIPAQFEVAGAVITEISSELNTLAEE